MGITVKNTTPDTAKITLVGEMMDGSFDARVMAETDVPYTKYWDNELEQRIDVVPVGHRAGAVDDDEFGRIRRAQDAGPVLVVIGARTLGDNICVHRHFLVVVN